MGVVVPRFPVGVSVKRRRAPARGCYGGRRPAFGAFIEDPTCAMSPGSVMFVVNLPVCGYFTSAPPPCPSWVSVTSAGMSCLQVANQQLHGMAPRTSDTSKDSRFGPLRCARGV